MERIVSDVIKIIKGSKNEIEMEKVLWTFLLNTIITMIALAFERIDDELLCPSKQKDIKCSARMYAPFKGSLAL
ncbi:MAG: hypothetical protein SOU94_00635 [Acidaminococcus sp.]|uniref:Uncharacterized protein n=1 Tax=Acidaminococcus intestini TaxID=187327 RepID=A0A943I5X1_9FIRM|nr:hypothetical protein [Acidaminococcus sp.]MBS5520133.1 hypothetical protein [Acidaminococcus intestini]MDY2738322.1 hypothetical protein [Acidaminococcus sp.]